MRRPGLLRSGCRAAWAVGLALIAGCAGGRRLPAGTQPREIDRFVGSEASVRLGTEGWFVVEELRRDLDGDGVREAVLVEGRLGQGPEPEVLRLSTWVPTTAGWQPIETSEEVPGSEVGVFALIPCGERDLLLFAAVEREPDLERHRLLVFDGLPELRRLLGVQRDVEASAPDTGFVAEPSGFRFDRGAAAPAERWVCVDGRLAPEAEREPTPP